MNQTPAWKILLKLSPPVMLALLIQSVYNIVDSYFIARYSPGGLTALSVVFPLQLLMGAIATGTGTGLNILVSRMDGEKNLDGQERLIRCGLLLGFINYLIFTAVAMAGIGQYCRLSSDQPLVQRYGIEYSQIIFLFSAGMFLEANCTKLLQAKEKMLLPMAAQMIGALINIVLDPVLIFGVPGIPAMGIKGAAIATVIGQWCAMAIVLIPVLRRFVTGGKCSLHDCLLIYRAGMPAIVMQSLYTLYMTGLNLVLKTFSEDAVTVLGIYYKLQTFFFIPLLGLQQVILPLISFQYGAGKPGRAKEILKSAIILSSVLMIFAWGIFLAIPEPLLSVFSRKEEILTIGSTSLRVISLSFIPAAFVIMLTVYFQGIQRGASSIRITLFRQVFLLVPLAWLFHFWGLSFVWLTFPVTEIAALILSLRLYKRKDSLSLNDVKPKGKSLKNFQPAVNFLRTSDDLTG